MEPERLYARIAPFSAAITAAKKEGITWREIAALFNTDAKATEQAARRARKGIDAGRLVVDQKPLPEPKAQATAKVMLMPKQEEGATQTENAFTKPRKTFKFDDDK